ncbi:MAG: DUF1311 domain-containing protein [Alphaproteobacteria bacterium]|nr:DUF1311 domain-containing protein [Alphaproteobacteria bacterium]
MSKKLILALTLCLLPQIVFATPEYDACYKKAQTDDEVALCMKAESARLLKNIQDIYLNVANHPRTSVWNNGNALISGNLKDMYDYWMAYRNRYCSLFTKASEDMFGSENFDKERCLLNLTTDHYELMQKILINANSGGEENDED